MRPAYKTVVRKAFCPVGSERNQFKRGGVVDVDSRAGRAGHGSQERLGILTRCALREGCEVDVVFLQRCDSRLDEVVDVNCVGRFWSPTEQGHTNPGPWLKALVEQLGEHPAVGCVTGRVEQGRTQVSVIDVVPAGSAQVSRKLMEIRQSGLCRRIAAERSRLRSRLASTRPSG